MSDEALVARVEQHDAEITTLKEALLDLSGKVFWLYNACDFLDREEAIMQIHQFNMEYGLAELDVVDQAEFDDLSPEDFGTPDDA